MKSSVFGLNLVAVAGLFFAALSSAHHSQSEFDPQLAVDIEGSVNRLEWRSPHARLYVDVVDENGETVVWDFELPSPTTLMRRGWSRNSLKAGEAVTVTGFRARDFPTIAYARTVKDKDGNGVFTGITEVNQPDGQP